MRISNHNNNLYHEQHTLNIQGALMAKSIWLLIFPLFFVASVANAGFLIEPIIGYQTGKAETKLLPADGGTSNDVTANGIIGGLGLGWRFDNKILVGADLLMSSLDTTFSTPFANAPDKWTGSAYYLTGGYQAHPQGKVYVGIGGFSAEDNATTKTKYTGTSLKAGAGYEFKNHIALHVDYVLYTLTESQTGAQAAVKTADLYEKFNYMATIMSFRFPFEFK